MSLVRSSLACNRQMVDSEVMFLIVSGIGFISYGFDVGTIWVR